MTLLPAALTQTAAAFRELIDDAIVALGEKALHWYDSRRFDESKAAEFLARGGRMESDGPDAAESLAADVDAYDGETEDMAAIGRVLLKYELAKMMKPAVPASVAAPASGLDAAPVAPTRGFSCTQSEHWPKPAALWLRPAILEVFASHAHSAGGDGWIYCYDAHDLDSSSHARLADHEAWCDHIADDMAEHLCKALAALPHSPPTESGQDMGASMWRELFPQHQKDTTK